MLMMACSVLVMDDLHGYVELSSECKHQDVNDANRTL